MPDPTKATTTTTDGEPPPVTISVSDLRWVLKYVEEGIQMIYDIGRHGVFLEDPRDSSLEESARRLERLAGTCDYQFQYHTFGTWPDAPCS